jgi:peptidoglycan/LPS O-acetylase OafA/YrhL
MDYRREIDGLRALAVVPVILFHAGFRAFSGGFVGVDVFFVISGYLITSLILAEKARGNFSLAGFYERRARRILPALFVVMAACIPAAWLYLMPSDMKSFSESLAAVSVFASNVLFYNESGYFAADAELKPLLHTWSLAVEEQFYVLFPLFLLAAWHWGRKWTVASLAVVALFSLGLAQWGASVNPAATFLFLSTRACELLLGALIAFHCDARPSTAGGDGANPWINEVAGFAGVAMILLGVFAFDRETPFPGLYALLPTVGTALVILFAHPRTGVGKLLGSRTFVGLGLISYSAYLWHQPLFAFARHRSLEEPGRGQLLWLALLAVALAYLSWRYVEKPFRDRSRFSRTQVARYGVLCSLAFVAFGLLGYRTNGFEGRFTSDERAVLAYTTYAFRDLYRVETCLLEPDQAFTDFSEQCAPSRVAGGTLIWGDSHAAAISPGLRQRLPGAAQYTASGCPPLVDVEIGDRPQCRKINDFVKDEIRQLQPGNLVLHANWRRYRKYDVTRRLGQTIEYVRRVSPWTRITIVGVVPQWNPGLPVYMVRNHVPLAEEQFVDNAYVRNGRVLDKVLREAAERNGAAFFSAIDALCVSDRCRATTGNGATLTLTMWDSAHLTEGGSMLLAAELAQRLK